MTVALSVLVVRYVMYVEVESQTSGGFVQDRCSTALASCRIWPASCRIVAESGWLVAESGWLVAESGRLGAG